MFADYRSLDVGKVGSLGREYCCDGGFMGVWSAYFGRVGHNCKVGSIQTLRTAIFLVPHSTNLSARIGLRTVGIPQNLHLSRIEPT